MSKRELCRRTVKRICDLAIAAPGLLAILPILAAIAVVIRFALGRPVLFRQVRPGYLEKPFTMYKFRTMRESVDLQGRPLSDGERLHPLGIFLRRTSLDELPEFWNVLRGDMSLIGPRPLLVKYLPYYTEEERIRFTVRPGITGWAQVNGRSKASWDYRLRNDIWYVRNWSLLVDLRVLWMTLVMTIRCKQVVPDARSVMPDLDEERAHMKQRRAERTWTI